MDCMFIFIFGFFCFSLTKFLDFVEMEKLLLGGMTCKVRGMLVHLPTLSEPILGPFRIGPWPRWTVGIGSDSSTGQFR